MSLLVLTTQGGATLPAMLAVRVEDASNWRVAVGCWAVLMVVAALPWIVAILRDRRGPIEQTTAGSASGPAYGLPVLIRDRVSIGAALFYSMAAVNTYALLAWLPTIFADQGQTQAQAATMYSIYTFMTLPMAAVTPAITSKLKNPLPLGVLLSCVAAIGYFGILFAPPSTAMVWAFVAGVGGGAFPFAMTMFNLRTRSAIGSASITGFALRCGYAVGTVGPFLGGLLSTATGSWVLRFSFSPPPPYRWPSGPTCSPTAGSSRIEWQPDMLLSVRPRLKTLQTVESARLPTAGDPYPRASLDAVRPVPATSR